MKFYTALKELFGLASEEMESPGLSAAAFKPPLCFVLEGGREGASAAAMMAAHNVPTQVFGALSDMMGALARAHPQLVLLGSSLDVSHLREAVRSLSTSRFSGSVQPVVRSERIESADKALAGLSGLRVLSSVPAPMNTRSVDALVKSEGLTRTNTGYPDVDLNSALVNNWVEFWYQPRIDLRTRMLTGAECIARVRHPVHGPLPRPAFMTRASDTALRVLGRLAIRTAVADWQTFLRAGVNVPLSTHLPRPMWEGGHMMPILRRFHPDVSTWPGLGFDIDCAAIESGLLMQTYADDLMELYRVRVGVNDFRASPRTSAALKDFPFAKIKLPRSLVNGVAADTGKQKLCEKAIELAHAAGSRVAATGVSNKEDVGFLMRQGCDIAQGRLFSGAVPRDEFTQLLKKRARAPSVYRGSEGASQARSGIR